MKKIISNALLAVAMTSSPALAMDVDRHSHELNTTSWSSSVLEQVTANKAAGDIVKKIRLENCSTPDVFIEKFSESTEFDSQNIQDYYESFKDSLSKFKTLNSTDFPDLKSLDASRSVVVKLDQIISILGGNAYQHFKNENDIDTLDLMAQALFGMSDSSWLEVDSGLKDYVNGNDLTVGDILYKGCLASTPESPDELVVIVSNGNVNGIPFKDINFLLNEDMASRLQYKMQINTSGTGITMDDNWAHASSPSSDGLFKDMDLINLNTSTMQGALTSSMRDLSHADNALLSDMGFPYVTLHEIKHSHHNQEVILDNLRNNFNTLSPQEKYSTFVHAEVEGDLFPVGEIAKALIRKGDESSIDLLVDAVKSKRIKDHEKTAEDVKLLQSMIAESSLPETLKSVPYNKMSFTKGFQAAVDALAIDDPVQKDKALSDSFYEIKDRYQVEMAIDSLSIIIKSNPETFASMSEEQTKVIYGSIMGTVMSSPEMQRVIQTPEENIVAYDGEGSSIAKVVSAASKHIKLREPDENTGFNF